jgi:hypothetical protein
LSSDSENRKKEDKLIDQMKAHLKVKDNEVILKPTFLDYVLEQFNELFQYLDKAIQVKYARPFRRTAPIKRKKSKVNLP